MKKRSVSLALAAVLVTATLTACDESAPVQQTQQSTSGTPELTQSVTSSTRDEDEFAATDAEIKELNTDTFVPDGKSGKIVWLGYYDLIDDDKSAEQYKIFTSDAYGGEIEYINCSSGSGYYEALGVQIAADSSPDIVRYDWPSFPYAMSKNMYEPLDDYINIENPLWSGMADTIENFAFNGKHYYYPHKYITHFALNYNRKVLEENGLPDPYDLYKENNWTWDTYRQLMIDWCNLDDENIGMAGEGGMSFIATTGTALIDVQPDGTVVNNINDPNVTRAMQFCSELYRDGLTHRGELGNWVSPQIWAKNSDRLLFLGMNPEWTYSAASMEIQNPSGVDNDICGVASDFAFVPFPRDPASEEYCIAYDTFGYFVAKGASNVKGAIDWINLNRVYETDENRLATAKKDATNPKPVYYTEGKYTGSEKWQLVWDEKQYDLWQEMLDPTNFTFTFDDCNGFGDEMKEICDSILFEPMYNGESWTQLSEEKSGMLNAVIASMYE